MSGQETPGSLMATPPARAARQPTAVGDDDPCRWPGTALHRDFFENAREGYLLTDAKGRICSANPAAGALLRRASAALVGRYLEEFSQEQARPAFHQRLAQIRTDRHVHDWEMECHRGDDQTIILSAHVRPILGPNGTAVALTWLLREKHEPHRTAAALRQEHDFAESLVHAAQLLVLICDSQGGLRRCNAYVERLAGYRQAELVGRDWIAMLVPKRDQTLARETLIRAWDCTDPQRAVHAIQSRQGPEREIEWYTRARCDDSGKPQEILALGRDITDLKQAQERALEAERLAAIGQMASGLAHEGRNALQRSQCCLEMLRLQMQDRPRALDLLTRIQQAQDDLQHLYEEVRAYSAPILLRRQVCSLREILQRAWANLESQRRGRDVHLHDGCSAHDIRAALDPLLMERVFQNIFENALAAGVDAVGIEVVCSETQWRERPGLHVVIRDNGPGLTAEQTRRMFEPFYTTKTHGTGLGMAIARRIVEAHEGRIDAANGQSGGAEISIILPRGRT